MKRGPKLEPGEWVLFAFLAYALVRLLSAGHFGLNQKSVPPIRMFGVFLGIMCVRLLAEYRRVPWPPEAARARRVHLAFLAFFLVALPALFFASPALRLDTPSQGGRASQILFDVYVWTAAVLLVVVPFTLFWLASAEYIKEHGRLETVPMFRQWWPKILETLRAWFPLFMLIYCYGLMQPVIGQGLFGDQDALLARWDRLLFAGHDPRVLCEAIISRPLSEWLSAAYIFYAPLYPIVLAAVSAKADAAPFRELAFALTLTLAVGYVLYTVVPAQGPLFLDKFDVDLDVYYAGWLKWQLMDRTRVPRDCFPSLHTAASLTLLWGAFRHVRWLFWVLLPVVLSIPLACVYLRYHYVVDVLAGILLTLAVTQWTIRSTRLQAAFRR